MFAKRNYYVVFSLFWTVYATPDEYANKFVLHAEGGMDVALDLARKYDCRFLGQVGSIPDRYILERNQLERNGKKTVSYSTRNTELENEMMSETGVKDMEQQTFTHRVKKALNFNDPSYSSMWYVTDANWHLNVMAAWENGWTGQGVVVAVVDDGLETTHTDLAANYDASASYDYALYVSDPSPVYIDDSHGTACAGEIAAVANNSNCIVGIAYNSRIGGIRVLDIFMTDADEAAALSHKPQYIDIYSNSWGPADDGYYFGGPGTLAKTALIDGVTNGRGGKGSIYVWAAGNGGHLQDACGADGYVNSIYTIAITAVTSNGQQAYYGEKCGAIMAATMSGGNYTIGEQYISTTTLGNECINDFSGTSAAAPLASGIIALILQANSDLSWRDVQHIIAETALSDNLTDGEWFVNGAGHTVSHKYGFGLMNAAKMVDLAQNWVSVNSQIQRNYTTVSTIFLYGTGINHEEKFEVTRDTNANELKALEHVVVTVSIDHDNVNDIEISLTSPMQTTSIVLHTRGSGINGGWIANWPFMTVHFWGESPYGNWTVTVRNRGSAFYYGWITKIQLTLYGTENIIDETVTAETTIDGTVTMKTTNDETVTKATTLDETDTTATTIDEIVTKAITIGETDITATTIDGNVTKATTNDGTVTMTATNDGTTNKATTHDGTVTMAATNDGAVTNATTTDEPVTDATSGESRSDEPVTDKAVAVNLTLIISIVLPVFCSLLPLF